MEARQVARAKSLNLNEPHRLTAMSLTATKPTITMGIDWSGIQSEPQDAQFYKVQGVQILLVTLVVAKGQHLRLRVGSREVVAGTCPAMSGLVCHKDQEWAHLFLSEFQVCCRNLKESRPKRRY